MTEQEFRSQQADQFVRDYVKNQPPEKATILQEALDLITTDRNVTYGDPAIQMNCAAQMSTIYLANTLGKNGGNITAHDLCVIVALMKISRIACGAYKRDNYVDAAGYLAIAGELKLKSENTGATNVAESNKYHEQQNQALHTTSQARADSNRR